MEWQVKIEGKPKERILVSFEPRYERIIFSGQYSIKNKWIDFSAESHPMDIDLETIQSFLIKVYDEMSKRLKVYDDLNKSFEIIKSVEMVNE
jgi:FMN phosphatase YigB (HAD superfamily)